MPRTEEANQIIREQRRTQILDKSVNVFARKGFTDTKISDIALANEMSQGLIYRYFSSKEELYGIVVEGTLQLMVNLARQAAKEAEPGLDRIRWFTGQLLPYLYERPEGTMLIMQALTNEAVPPAVKEMAVNSTIEVIATIQQFIVEGQQASQITRHDTYQLAVLFMSTLNGLSAGASFLENAPAEFPDIETVIRFLKA
ncbi:MAG TPA: TetR/AcrR family transcriptional regulator [Chloroflexia bacterium]|nr:TetR/AcrR family transcriptional regulator [Chloroflexia bacterium]